MGKLNIANLRTALETLEDAINETRKDLKDGERRDTESYIVPAVSRARTQLGLAFNAMEHNLWLIADLAADLRNELDKV